MDAILHGLALFAPTMRAPWNLTYDVVIDQTGSNKMAHSNTIIVPLSKGYYEYCQPAEPIYSRTAGCRVQPSKLIRFVDYSDVCDACLDDMPEGRYLK